MKYIATLFSLTALTVMMGCAHNAVEAPGRAGSVEGETTASPSKTVAPAADVESSSASDASDHQVTLPTIFIAGDSTAARNSSPIQQGWAEPFKTYFDADKVNIVNRARGGRSSRTFITEGLWEELLRDMRRGDIVLIQFGHNDGGAINDERRARGSIRGLGEETEAIDNLVTKQHEVVHTYGHYMRRMIADTKAKGAIPIVLSLTIRNRWEDGKVERGSGRYGEWAKAIARAAGVQFVDLTARVADEFDAMGEEAVTKLYERDYVHFNPEGADLHARFVVQGLKELPDDPVSPYLSEAGRAISVDETARSRQPRRVGPLHEGFNPNLATLWLIGDSTVKNSWDTGSDGLWGWGRPATTFFDRTRINVENQALGGTSSRSFLTLGLWEAVRVQIQPGDFVLMQFGHNDGGGAYDDSRARKSIRGSGEETVDVVLQESGLEETVHTYGWYLQQYAKDIRGRGATPIICSLVPRNDWTDGEVHRADESYAKWAREAAETSGTLFIDLNALVADRYDQMGEEAVKPFFPKEHTHTGWEGAVVNAECVVQGIRSLSKCTLRDYLLENPSDPEEP